MYLKVNLYEWQLHLESNRLLQMLLPQFMRPITSSLDIKQWYFFVLDFFFNTHGESTSFMTSMSLSIMTAVPRETMTPPMIPKNATVMVAASPNR
jgi:hypothetical protein